MSKVTNMVRNGICDVTANESEVRFDFYRSENEERVARIDCSHGAALDLACAIIRRLLQNAPDGDTYDESVRRIRRLLNE